MAQVPKVFQTQKCSQDPALMPVHSRAEQDSPGGQLRPMKEGYTGHCYESIYHVAKA